MQGKQIRLIFSKIYNWPSENKQIELDLQFYSKQSQHLITRKHIKSITHNNSLTLDTSLLIRYTKYKIQYKDILAQIVVSIKQTNGDCEDFGEVQLNLTQMQTQRMKYFTFGEFSKVLQVHIAQQQIEANQDPVLEDKKKSNQNFIEQRRIFLTNYTQTQNKLKKQFEQKIINILHEEKLRKPRPIRNIEVKNSQKMLDKTEQELQIIEYVQSEIKQKPVFQIYKAKSTTDDRPEDMRVNRNYQGSPHERIPNSVRKHKLILNTLNIVPKQENK